MKVIPINKSTTNVAKTGKFSKFAKAAVLTAGLAAGILPSCKKYDDVIINNNNNVPTATTERTDLIDFAFRDLVNSHNLDTVGRTKVLKQSYPLNDGCYTIDTFEYNTNNPDEIKSHGVYHYEGNDAFMPSDIPYTAIWTKVISDFGEEAVHVDYKYPYERQGSSKLTMPEPNEAIYIPGSPNDNQMRVVINPGTGNFFADVKINDHTASWDVENIHIDNPYNVEILENYPNKK